MNTFVAHHSDSVSASEHHLHEHHVEEDRPSSNKAAFHGLKVIAFVTNTPVCRNALHLARGLLAGRCTELILANCAANAYSLEGMTGILESLADHMIGVPVKTDLFSKREDQTLLEALAEYAENVKPDLVVIASKSLCTAGSDSRTSLSGDASAAAKARPTFTSSNGSRGAQSQTFAMKLCQQLRSVPVLLFKSNTKGSFLTYVDQGCAPMKYMVDLQPTSRHMLAWLMNIMDNKKDNLFLAVSKAYEITGVTKQMAVRMITAFSVQASVNKLHPVQRLFKHEGERALPQAVVEDDIDIVMIQAPRSRDLSPYVVDVICNTAASILIYPPDSEDTALGVHHDAIAEVHPVRSDAAAAGGGLPPPHPTERRSSGYSYGYGAQAPQVDSAAQAALEAMQARQAARRKASDDKSTANTASQRAGW